MLGVPPEFSVAAGILVERGNEVLLVETPRRGWEFPGGRIEEGETIVDGVLRELREEANIAASLDRLVGVYTNLSAGRVIFDFQGTWLSGEARKGFETTDVAWVAKSEAMRMVEHPAYHRRMQQLLEFDGRVLFLSYTMPPFTVCQETYV
ncbi:MAG: NUDIX domain-containing protein [Gemmatimonadetes bacterium]|nr:NUDIX domain-containing protein [Gemmatimonadota bacterium]